MTSKFLHCSCLKHKEENAQKAEISPPFVFKLMQNGEAKTT
jgi:hypothetical protein